MANEAEPQPSGKRLATLMLATLGIVYGDIGTSPLYAFRECLGGTHGVSATHANVLGILSLIFWSLVVVLSLKYVTLILQADNDGEGGILALMALIRRRAERPAARRPVLIILGLFGAALLYGDGMITPAISVLSAIEGLKVATPIFAPYVVPLTLVILCGLFLVQKKGTQRIGIVFGPVTLLWFLALAALGIVQIVAEPATLAAINPRHAIAFFRNGGWPAFTVLGSVFLVVTGAEALYADMGHFGRRPIRMTWFAVVFPCLLLNYFGQGSLLLAHPEAIENPFYHLVPRSLIYPMVVLATAATIIASQAVISGAFSLTRQAVRLGYFPRVTIVHTSKEEIGQIYVGSINWVLFAATIGLVLGFESSSSLAAAYGVAVVTTMAITTVFAYVVMRERWRWPWLVAVSIAAGLWVIDFSFLSANAMKIPHGGWFPLVIGAVGYVVMSTWRRGRELLAERLRERSLPFDEFRRRCAADPPADVRGTAIYLTSNPRDIPPMILHNLQHNRVLHERVVFMTFVTEEHPRLPREERLQIQPLGERFYRVVAHYGFMEEPSVYHVIARCTEAGLPLDIESTTFFLGRETLLATEDPEMPIWREKLFALLSRNTAGVTRSLKIPSERIVELGAQIEL